MLRQIFNNLQASLQDTYNNRQHTIAQAGGETHSHTRKHAAATSCSQLPVTCCYRTIQVVHIKFPMQRLIYPINWLASKLMITGGSSPTNSLVPDCNPPKAATLVLADGTLVPVLPLCQASACGNPKRYYRNSHNYSPHGGSFCPQKQSCGYCSSGIRLALMSS